MDFALSEEQTAIFDMAKCLRARTILHPHSRSKWERRRHHSQASFGPQTRGIGLWRRCMSRKRYGGSGLTRLGCNSGVRGAERWPDPSVAVVPVDPQHVRRQDAGYVSASDDMTGKSGCLPDILLDADRAVSYCLTEPGSGSDAAALKTRAGSHRHEGYR